ncbi:uncharacterized protein LOC108086292 [Drosophila ficusphila]|uniref:uncharacterized protein LOC108086292 n=1 Tax=Drosophila ficusphila TaxID=30025 RepID=UPI0007E89194|nr:uncharacterized protein LOC108086292 [Drosophila ficusphila]
MQRLVLIFGIILLAALANVSLSSNTHYHRYMLSDYKAQHNPKTQMDYKRRRARTGDTTDQPEELPPPQDQNVTFGDSREPFVILTKSKEKVSLHELMVRIYKQSKYICMGTIISPKLVVTADTCFDEKDGDTVHMKMHDNEIIEGKKIPLNETFLKGADPLLVAIQVDKLPKNSSVVGDTVKLCDSELENYSPVEVPLWIRKRHSIHSQTSFILPLQECRHRMNDRQGLVAIDTMFCVRNPKYTVQCQLAIGNPLIHDGEICGINVAGHNCPVFTGVDLYIKIYDALEFSIVGMELIKNSRIEDTIL